MGFNQMLRIKNKREQKTNKVIGKLPKLLFLPPKSRLLDYLHVHQCTPQGIALNDCSDLTDFVAHTRPEFQPDN